METGMGTGTPLLELANYFIIILVVPSSAFIKLRYVMFPECEFRMQKRKIAQSFLLPFFL
jgi:hypothetical protein